MDAEIEGQDGNVKVFDGSDSYEIELEATGYPSVKGTVIKQFEIVDSKQKAGCHMTRSQPFVEYRTATNERKEDFHESKEKFC